MTHEIIETYSAGQWIALPYAPSSEASLKYKVISGYVACYQDQYQPLTEMSDSQSYASIQLVGEYYPEKNNRSIIYKDNYSSNDGYYNLYGLRAQTEVKIIKIKDELKPVELVAIRHSDDQYTLNSIKLKELSTNAFTNILVMIMLMVVSARVMISIPHLPSTVFLAFNITMVLLCLHCCMAVIRAYGSDEIKFGFNMKHTTLLGGLISGILWSIPIVATMGLIKLIYMPGMWLTLAANLSETLIYLTISVPIQEIVARGVLQTVLVKLFSHVEHLGDYSEWSALIMANLLFTVAHLHLGLGFSLASMMCGFVWGYLFKESKSLLAPIVSHFIAGFILCAWDMGAVLQHMAMAQHFSAYTHFVLANPWGVSAIIFGLFVIILQSSDVTKLNIFSNVNDQNLLSVNKNQQSIRSSYLVACDDKLASLNDRYQSPATDESIVAGKAIA
ncbi:MAG: CPBP family intramembrane glutamic endopeptidase [Candidatus Comchoanobacterales bacterium]